MDYEKIRLAWLIILISSMIITMVYIFAFDSKMTTFYVLLEVLVIFVIEIIFEVYRRKNIENN